MKTKTVTQNKHEAMYAYKRNDYEQLWFYFDKILNIKFIDEVFNSMKGVKE